MGEGETTWSAKEVFSDLKSDLMKRFDNQDAALVDIRHELSNTATKDDIREVNQRIDRHDSRISSLEDTRTADKAVVAGRRMSTASLRWAVGISATCAFALVAALIEAHIW